MNRHFMQSPSLNPEALRKSNKSKYQYFLHNVIPYIDICSLRGFPVHQLYYGKRTPKILGIVTNIFYLILACRKAPTQSNCFNLTFRLLACARNIFSDLKEAVGDHSSSVLFLSCRLLQTTSHIFKLSNDL
jgi:hypothetical protein